MPRTDKCSSRDEERREAIREKSHLPQEICHVFLIHLLFGPYYEPLPPGCFIGPAGQVSPSKHTLPLKFRQYPLHCRPISPIMTGQNLGTGWKDKGLWIGYDLSLAQISLLVGLLVISGCYEPEPKPLIIGEVPPLILPPPEAPPAKHRLVGRYGEGPADHHPDPGRRRGHRADHGHDPRQRARRRAPGEPAHRPSAIQPRSVGGPSRRAACRSPTRTDWPPRRARTSDASI